MFALFQEKPKSLVLRQSDKKNDLLNKKVEFWVNCFLRGHYHQASYMYQQLIKNYSEETLKRHILVVFQNKIQAKQLSSFEFEQLKGLIANIVSPSSYSMAINKIPTINEESRNMLSKLNAAKDELAQLNSQFLSDFISPNIQKTFRQYFSENKKYKEIKTLEILFEEVVKFVSAQCNNAQQLESITHAEQIVFYLKTHPKIVYDMVKIGEVAQLAFAKVKPPSYQSLPSAPCVLLGSITIKPMQMLTKYESVLNNIKKYSADDATVCRIDDLTKKIKNLLEGQNKLKKIDEHRAKINFLAPQKNVKYLFTVKKLNASLKRTLPLIDEFNDAIKYNRFFFKQKTAQRRLKQSLKLFLLTAEKCLSQPSDRVPDYFWQFIFSNLASLYFFCMIVAEGASSEKINAYKQRLSLLIESIIQSSSFSTSKKEITWQCAKEIFAGEGSIEAKKNVLAEVLLPTKKTSFSALPSKRSPLQKIAASPKKIFKVRVLPSMQRWLPARSSRCTEIFTQLSRAFNYEQKRLAGLYKETSFNPQHYVHHLKHFTQGVITAYLLEKDPHNQVFHYLETMDAERVQKLVFDALTAEFARLDHKTLDRLSRQIQLPAAQQFFDYVAQRKNEAVAYRILHAYRQCLMDALDKIPVMQQSRALSKSTLLAIEDYQAFFSIYPTNSEKLSKQC